MSTVTLPNLITIGRLMLVPLVIWLIVQGRLDLAFWLFLLAGVSDAIDGWIARRFDMRSPLGSFLDPLADKVLLVSIYVTLGIVAALPSWLVILVVSRDVLIVGAVLLTWVMGETVESRPLMISKINTAAQIVLAALVLGDDAFRLDGQWLVEVGVFAVAGLTIASGGAYVAGWLRTMSATPDAPGQRQSRRSEDAGAAPNPETPP